MLIQPWHRTLWLIVFVQFVMSAALSATEPVIPLVLPEIGLTEASEVRFWSGVISSMNFLLAALVSPFWGAVSDRFGRKLLVMNTGFVVCIFTGMMGLSQELWQFVALRALMGAFSGFYTSSITLVATQVPSSSLGFALGWLATGQMTGNLFGPLLGGLVADISGSYRSVFFVTAGLAMLVVAILMIFVKESFTPVPRDSRIPLVQGIKKVLAYPGFFAVVVVLVVSQLGIRSIQPLVTLFVQELVGPVPILVTLAGFAFSITGLADLIVSPFLGKRSDTIGYRRVLLICFMGCAVVCVPQAFVGEYWQFLALRFALGMFMGGLVPTASALLGRLVAPARRGVAYGLATSAMHIGSFLGPLSGGAIAAVFGIRSVFIVTAVVFLLGFVWVWFTLPKQVPSQPD